MTFADAKTIAEALKDLKPDPETGTVGERLLWGRLLQRLYNVCAERVTRSWNPGAWREAAGVDPSHRE